MSYIGEDEDDDNNATNNETDEGEIIDIFLEYVSEKENKWRDIELFPLLEVLQKTKQNPC